MPLFTYKARSKEGEIYERTVEAPERLALYSIIRAEGGVLISVKEKRTFKWNVSFGTLFGGVKTQEKINFAKNLGSMIDAGLSVTRALGVMSKQSKKKSLQTLFTTLENDVSHGSTLSDALAKHPNIFSPLFISMVRAGEESGSVSESLRVVASQMEKSYQLVKKVRGAMIYPAVIIGVMIVLAILLLIFMVPTLTATFQGIGIALPLPTRIVIFASEFAIAHTLLIVVGLAALIALALAFWRSVMGKKLFDRLSLRIPVVGGIAQEVQVARTARTLSSLMVAGVEIVSAIQVTKEVLQNHLYKEALEEAYVGIQKGEALSAVFGRHENLYPVFVTEMISVGEETGKIADMLLGVGNYYENEVDQKTKDLSTIIEPVLMIIIGAGVGIFAISMLAPTYSLVDYI